MSYDFWLEIDTGGEEPLRIVRRFTDQHPALDGDGIAGNVEVGVSGYIRCGNYTSNVSDIWARCLTAAADQECIGWWVTGHRVVKRAGNWVRHEPRPEDSIRLADLDGKSPAGDLAPLFAAAVEWGISNRRELRNLEPPNGWGNVDGAITYLWDIQRMCEAHPKATLRLSW